jgi:tetratricopeptide (TPR) repeat protein
MDGRTLTLAVVAACGLALAPAAPLSAAPLDDAQHLFYSALFQESAAAAKAIADAEPGNLAAWEVRTSALHFQLRRLFGEPKDRKAALAKCAECRALLTTFLDDVNRGRAAARERINQAPEDEEARFFLGKLDLSYLWMQLSTLGRKTGWDEYWEAKRLLEAIIEKNPMHVRARVARGWMDYIVGSRVPWGTRWVMGGGSKSRGLKMARDAAQTPSDTYTRAEAQFALWEMLSRDGKRDEALGVAKELLVKFPENKDLLKFLATGGRPSETASGQRPVKSAWQFRHDGISRARSAGAGRA